MPSWNIHIAQTERLLARAGSCARAVRDADAFLFGNVVPDIFVGYMVPDIKRRIAYSVTHLTDPEAIPRPREREFWDACVAPLLGHRRGGRGHAKAAREGRGAGGPAPAASPPGCLRDLCLGAWTHLVADNLWNTQVRAFLFARGGAPSEQFRIKKQGDFDWFGKTLSISSVPRAAPALYAAAAAFPPYPIDRESVDRTIAVMAEIVRANPGTPEHPPYLLLSDEFFAETLEEVLDVTEDMLAERLRDR